jgi:hypothetical protein
MKTIAVYDVKYDEETGMLYLALGEDIKYKGTYTNYIILYLPTYGKSGTPPTFMYGKPTLTTKNFEEFKKDIEAQWVSPIPDGHFESKTKINVLKRLEKQIQELIEKNDWQILEHGVYFGFENGSYAAIWRYRTYCVSGFLICSGCLNSIDSSRQKVIGYGLSQEEAADNLIEKIKKL